MTPQANKPVEGARLVLIALGLAFLAVILDYFWIQRIRTRNETASMTIYLLTRDVKKGELIAPIDFEPNAVPKTAAFQTTFNAMHAADKHTIDNFVDQRWGQDASQGELVTEALFSPAKALGTLPPPALDKAHIAISVTDTKQPGDLRQGDFVELRAPFRTPAGPAPMVTVIEKVKIVQLGPTWTSEETGRTTSQAPSYRAATLEIYKSDVPLLDAIRKDVAGEFEMVRINPEVPGSMEVTQEAQMALRHEPGAVFPAPPATPGRPGRPAHPTPATHPADGAPPADPDSP